MNLTYLRSFYTSVKCNSISKAAKQLHLTQPGVSMQIQKLENEIDVKLLNRSNTGLSLTEAGMLTFEFAESMLSLQDNLEKKLQELTEQKTHLIISCCKSLGESAMPCSIYTFKEIYPNIDIYLESHNTSDIATKLTNHEINMGIIEEIPNEDHDFELIPLASDKLILVGGKDTSLRSIHFEDLLHLPLILREKGSANTAKLEDVLATNGIPLDKLNIVLYLNSPQAIKSSVTFGQGYAFLPEISITHELRNGDLKKIPIKDSDFSFSYYIAIRKNYKLSPDEEKFVRFLTSKKRCFCY